jgi:hypothetical protein
MATIWQAKTITGSVAAKGDEWLATGSLVALRLDPEAGGGVMLKLGDFTIQLTATEYAELVMLSVRPGQATATPAPDPREKPPPAHQRREIRG